MVVTTEKKHDYSKVDFSKSTYETAANIFKLEGGTQAEIGTSEQRQPSRIVICDWSP